MWKIQEHESPMASNGFVKAGKQAEDEWNRSPNPSAWVQIESSTVMENVKYMVGYAFTKKALDLWRGKGTN